MDYVLNINKSLNKTSNYHTPVNKEGACRSLQCLQCLQSHGGFQDILPVPILDTAFSLIIVWIAGFLNKRCVELSYFI